MKYYIAIDASGGKTEGILIEQTGKVMSHKMGSSANPFDIGAEMACNRICIVLHDLRMDLPKGEKLAGVYCSVSAIHYFPYMREVISRAAGNVPCELVSVVTPVIASVLGKEDGVCLISGTGSYCTVHKEGMDDHYFGSSGYLLDIGGSAYTIAQQGLVAVLREYDGRGKKTLITETIEKGIGETVSAHLPVIYVGGREYIASFSPYVFEAYNQGDEVARDIINHNVDCYIESLNKACEYFDGPFKVAMGGGVFREYPEYVNLVKEKAPSQCIFHLIDVPAVYGCALGALWNDNEEVPSDFKQNFLDTCVPMKRKLAYGHNRT